MRSQGARGGRRPRLRHVDALERVPIPNLPTVGLADSLDPRVDDLSARCAVRRGDHFPLSSLVDKTIANLKLRRQDAAPGWRCRIALLLGFRSSHRLLLSHSR